MFKGSILSLTSHVVFTAPEEANFHLLEQTFDPARPDKPLEYPLVNVMVQAEVISDRKTRERETTNVFHFTFRCEGNAKRILPHTYAGESAFMRYEETIVISITRLEAMSYLEARRRVIQGKEIQEHMKASLLENFGKLGQ